MKKKHILITGGAGFVGSYLTDALIAKGFPVRIFDNLETQVHHGKTPSYLHPKAQFVKGDVRDYKRFKEALHGIDVVYHLAARVGVGQSNYEIKDYVDTNISGMANLLHAIVNKEAHIQKIIMTASMTSYGEGLYRCPHCGTVKPALRDETDIRESWEPRCPQCESKLSPIPTSEETLRANNGVYSLTKNVQEDLLLLIGKLYRIPVVSLRCFNIYGPRQSLSNPYTGVAAIFISRLKNNRQPVVYEDGQQTRDFVSVHDVVTALIAAMSTVKADYQAINIGSGNPIPIKDLGELLANLLKKDIKPKVSGAFRKNDIRHCFADRTKAKQLLGWEPTVSLSTGLKELVAWSREEVSQDLFTKATRESKQKGLFATT